MRGIRWKHKESIITNSKLVGNTILETKTVKKEKITGSVDDEKGLELMSTYYIWTYFIPSGKSHNILRELL